MSIELPSDYFNYWATGIVALTKITALIVGYLTIKLGFVLVREGAKGEFRWTSQGTGWKLGLESASPGLLFVLLGTIIICWSLFVDKKFEEILESSENRGAKQDVLGDYDVEKPK